MRYITKQKMAKLFKVIRFLNSKKPFGLAVFDMFYQWQIHKIHPLEYIRCRYYVLSPEQKVSFVPMSEYNKLLQNIINSIAADDIKVLVDKGIALRRLPERLLKRSFLDLRQCSFADCENFIRTHMRFVIKRPDLAFGNEVFVIDVQSDSRVKSLSTSDLKKFYDECMTKELYIFEEYICQHDEWKKVNPSCVNTVRVHTLKISEQEYRTVWHWMPRFGRCGDAIDMRRSVAVLADPESGRIISDALLQGEKKLDVEKFSEMLEVHPDTGVRFRELVIPYHREIAETVIEAAAYFPEQRLIGWDVAITPTGPAIVEGNGFSQAFATIQYLYSTVAGGFGYRDHLLEVLPMCKNNIVVPPTGLALLVRVYSLLLQSATRGSGSSIGFLKWLNRRLFTDTDCWGSNKRLHQGSFRSQKYHRRWSIALF